MNVDTEEPFLGFVQPSHFPLAIYHFETNPVTKEGFELGRKLFYDPVLSADNTISCGSCHIQTAAFTQHGHAVSHGIHDSLGVRNTPPIMNLAWHTSIMLDGGINDLDLQPIAPITNHVEMGETMEHVIEKLKASSTYRDLFKNAYGTDEITASKMLKALSQFMLMCTSTNAKYDSVMQHNASFTDDEAAGYALYQAKCATCHAEPLFSDFNFRNNGLVPNVVNDMGRYIITLADTDKYRFKTPSLRNLTYTAPYMHDGRFLTLDAVLEHYNSGVTEVQNLDASLHQNGILGIPLSANDKKVLLAFLKTLDDRSFITNKLLSEQ